MRARLLLLLCCAAFAAACESGGDDSDAPFQIGDDAQTGSLDGGELDAAEMPDTGLEADMAVEVDAAEPVVDMAVEPPPDGAALYAMNCQRCHGPEARGGAIHPGSIQGETGIIGIVRSGRGVMPPFPELTDEEIAAIEAYLVSLAPVVELTPLERYSMECARCHGANGEGTADGPQIQSPVPGFATWVVRNGREGLGFPDEMPAFDEAVMPQADLDEIITWLHDQPLPVDGAGYYKRFCGNCHGADARGGNARHGLVGRRLAEYLQLVRSGVGGANYSSRTRYMPRFTTTELKDADVELIWQAVNGGSL